MKRILYLQYTNPAGYPPLGHSSRFLADAGWGVLFLGTDAFGASALEFAPHPRVTVRRLRRPARGIFRRLHYSLFCAWSVARAFAFRPDWIYASDPFSCVPALFLKRAGIKTLYHEHDGPVPSAKRSVFLKAVLSARAALARRADLCVLPGEARAAAFSCETGRSDGLFAVMNCPASDEARGERRPAADGKLRVYYHGNLSPELAPAQLVEAAARFAGRVEVCFTGYETAGNAGYAAHLREAAEKASAAAWVKVYDARPRFELWTAMRRSDVGWAVIPPTPGNPNMERMAGASNKAFDYLAAGMAVIVSDGPDWKKMYVEPGYGLACGAPSADAIAEILERFLVEPGLAGRMGGAGRERVVKDWNYETQFEPVRRVLDA